jgi:processive 1,2-diacylglycerol beta-glucosyltransferase
VAKLRILVLTSSTGGGHDARANAFAEWCFALYGHDIEVRIEQMLEKSSVLNRGGVRFYNWIQRRLPVLHTAFYTAIEGLRFLNRRSVVIGRAYYDRVLAEFRPHLVLSVHDCLNRGYFQRARQVLGAEKVRCATYCGEFSGGWGYSANWLEPSADLYISRTATARDYAIAHGIPPARARVRGHLMSPRAHLEQMDAGQRLHHLKRELRLRPGRFTVFLATGTNGANNHFALLPSLARHAGRCQAIIICGRNREVYNQLVQWRARHPGFACHIEGYSEDVHLLMQCSDAIITRGGTTTCAKALHYHCPIIFNAFGGVMPQERLTLKFFRNGAGSELIRDAHEFAEIIDRWMADPASYAAYKNKFTAARYEEDPTLLIDELVALAREAAPGGEPARQPFPPRNGNGPANLYPII